MERHETDKKQAYQSPTISTIEVQSSPFMAGSGFTGDHTQGEVEETAGD